MNNQMFARIFGNFSLRTKLIGGTVSIILIAVAIQGFVTNRAITATLQNNQNEILRSAASQTASSFDEHINAELTTLRINALITDFQNYLNAPAGERDERLVNETSTTLQNLLKREPLYTKSYSLLDRQGTSVLDTNPGSIGSKHFEEDYFQRVTQTNLPYFSAVRFLPDGSSVLYFSSPIHGEGGENIGVLLLTYDAAILQKWLVQNNDLAGPNSFPILLDENHIRLAHGAAPNLIFKSVTPLGAAELAELQAANRLPDLPADQLSTNLPGFKEALVNADSNPNFTTELLLAAEETNSGAVVRLSTQPWLVAYFQSTSAFLAPVQEQARNSLLVALGIAFVMAFAAFFIAQALSGPIVRLTAVAEQVAAGNINAQAEVESTDEIGTLARTFNSMTTQLRELIGSLEQRVADRTKALATSAEVSQRLSALLNEDQLVIEVVEQVKNAFNYYHAHIYLLDETGENLILAGGTGEAGKILLERGHKISRGRGLVGRAAERKELVIVPDTAKDANWLPNPLLPETRSEIAVPIVAGEHVLGVLDVQNNTVDSLGEQDAALLQTIANQVGIALQNIRQVINTQKIATDLSAVARVGIATATITDTDSLLQEVADLAKKSFNLYHAHIYLLNEAGDTLLLSAGAGEIGREMVAEGRSIPLSQAQSLVARAARTVEGVVVNDVRIDPDFLPNRLLPDTRSEMAVPMVVAGRVLGVLDVQSEHVNRFSETDINIQTTLASQVAVALQNARSFAQVRKQAEREAMLNAISQKIQSATSVEAVLQIAARELGHALGAPRTIAQLSMKDNK